jgi:hypothetical protein
MRSAFSFVLLSAALSALIGCSSSNTSNSSPTVSVSPNVQRSVDQGQSVSLTASVANDSSSQGVKWTVQCAVSDCGALSNQTSTSVTYTAPATVTSNVSSTVTATSIANSQAVASVQFTAVPLPSIPVGAGTPNGSGPPTGAQGATYSYTLQNAGGVAPFTWSITAGSLPTGLSLNATTGAISGTPTAGGTFNATATVTDSGAPAKAANAALTFVVTPSVAPLSITTTSLTAATQGAPYSASLSATGGVSPYTWSLGTGSGPLPAGLAIGGAGTISGTPTVSGTFPIVIQVSDASSPALTKTAAITLTVAASVINITTTSLNSATQNSAYSSTFAATGGTAPYKWAIATGSLPAGISLSQSGILSGTPTVAGSFPFTVAVQDSATQPNTSSASFTLTVNPPGSLTITTTSLDDGTIGSPYLIALQATGGKASYKWSLTSGSLPPGMNLVTGAPNQPGVASFTGGTLYGTPFTSGTYTFSVTVTDSTTPTAQTATQSFSFRSAPLSGTNNSWLNGHYAFYMVGFTDPDSCSPIVYPITDQPMTMTGSFIADGNGNITQGEYDSYVCGQSATQHLFTGTYSVGADQRGKLVMNNVINGQSTFAFSVEQIQSGVAQQAQFIEFDDMSIDQFGSRGSGIMQLQAPSDFAVASLNGNYVYGLTGSGPSAGLLTLNGTGNITGPSANGSYGTPDTIFGRTTFNINSTNYVMYMVNGRQAFLAATGTALSTANIAAGQMRMQQSATFNNGSLNGALVGYGVTPVRSGGQTGGAILYSVSADGSGNLTGSLNTGSHYGPSAFSTTYSVSSNGLALLGTGDVVWLYGPNAGYAVSGGGLMTYETAAGGPFTFDFTSGISSVGTLPPAAGNVRLQSGTYVSSGSGNSNVSLDFSTNMIWTTGFPAGTFTSTSSVASSSLPACNPGCSAPIALSATRAISLQSIGFIDTYPSPVFLIFQK